MGAPERRAFLKRSAAAALGLMARPLGAKAHRGTAPDSQWHTAAANVGASPKFKVFLAGDVMTGRGIDQILPHASPPPIREPYMRSARGYVQLAERANGPIPRPAGFAYVWGDALEVLDRAAPDVRVINLETAVTRSEDWAAKGINYRMHPENVACLTAARLDCCVLANNHVMDFGQSGLDETLRTLHDVGLKTAGAGRNRQQADSPALLPVAGKGRVLVFAFGARSSGIPAEWAADTNKPGISLLPDLTERTAQRIARLVAAVKGSGDIALASIHWGGNWGYAVPSEQRHFAHRLIDTAAVDIVHGHSSHHPRGIEVYRSKPILYGCGDLLNDYEGIGAEEQLRPDLALMYFVTMAMPNGSLDSLEMVPMQIRRFRLYRASAKDCAWLTATLDRECARLGSRVARHTEHSLVLRWHPA